MPEFDDAADENARVDKILAILEKDQAEAAPVEAAPAP